MTLDRRRFLGLTGATFVAFAPFGRAGSARAGGETMYGRIGKIVAVPGQRDALIDILLEGTRDMPGCLSYVVAKDTGDPDSLWVTEVWQSEESHRASLGLPAVQDAIGRGRPLIAAFGDAVVTEPVGGAGLG